MTTVVTPKQLEYWRHRCLQQQIHHQQLAQQARTDLEKIVSLLVQQFGATRIILFGSLVKGTFGEGSDIDLAVAGISPNQFFAAMSALNQIGQFWVDLKPLENLEPYFLNKVIKTGECLYEETIPQPCKNR
jgi:predicted nucleotidyltransferase